MNRVMPKKPGFPGFLLFILTLLTFPLISFSADKPRVPLSQWTVATYVGHVTSVDLGTVLTFHWHWADSYLVAGEFSYTPSPRNIIQRFFNIFKLKFEVSGNITYQDDKNGNLFEFNPFIDVRWNHFPWNRFIKTSLMIGEGVSYATRQPFQEVRDPKKKENAKQLLNFLVFEIALSLPNHPQWQVFYRIHHRSGAYGLFCNGLVGSTAVALGLRYRFP